MTPERARLIQELHDCGPRVLLELITELAAKKPGLMTDFETLAERYVGVGPSLYAVLGARDFPPYLFEDFPACLPKAS